MAWVTPKTDWDRDTDRFNYTDYNRIKGNVELVYILSVPYHGTNTQSISANNQFTVMCGHFNEGWNTDFVIHVTGETTDYTHEHHLEFDDQTGTGGTVVERIVSTTEPLTITWTQTLKYVGVEEYYEIEDMGNDKAVNDFWYADEWNTILDNLRLISEKTGIAIDEMPIYYPNGSTPTDDELNVIENNCLVIYNAIMGGE